MKWALIALVKNLFYTFGFHVHYTFHMMTNFILFFFDKEKKHFIFFFLHWDINILDVGNLWIYKCRVCCFSYQNMLIIELALMCFLGPTFLLFGSGWPPASPKSVPCRLVEKKHSRRRFIHFNRWIWDANSISLREGRRQMILEATEFVWK